MKKMLLFTIVTFLIYLNAFSTIITVSNNPNSRGEYTNLQSAIDAASDGDTILVTGSSIDYTADAITIDKKLTLYGQGYDPRKDAAFPSTVSAFLLMPSADGTIISGFATSIVTPGNAGEFGQTGVENVNNITISRCKLAGACFFSGSNWLFKDNVISNLIYTAFSSAIYFQNNLFSIEDGDGGGIYVDSSCTNVNFNNNYLGYTSTYDIHNAIFENNIFYQKTTTAINLPYLQGFNCIFENNIYFNSPDPNPLQIGINNNTGSGNINADPLFVSIDLTSYTVTRNDNFYLQPGSPGIGSGSDGKDIGPEGGSIPMQYPYSGEPDIPQIKTMSIYPNAVQADTSQGTFTATSTQPIKAAEYFFIQYSDDYDPGPGNGVPVQLSKLKSLIDTFKYVTYKYDLLPLDQGPVDLYFRIQDSAGNWSIAETREFTSVPKFVFYKNGDWDSSQNWVNGNAGPSTSIAGGMKVEIAAQCTKSEPLNLQPGAKLTIDAAKTLSLLSDLSNAGILGGTGVINFSGGDASSLNSPGLITPLLQLSNKKIYLTGNSNTDSIRLTSGSKLTLGKYNLNIDTASIVGDSANFVITNNTGVIMKKMSNNPVTFYIGTDSNTYTPITVAIIDTLLHRPNSPLGGTVPLTDVMIKANQGLLDLNSQPLTSNDSGTVNVTWTLEGTLAPGNVTSITPQWNIKQEGPGFNHGNCYLAQFKSCPPPVNCKDGYFQKQSVDPVTSLGSGNFSLTQNKIAALGNFTVSSLPTIYTFTDSTHNGNWDLDSNWTIGVVPPHIITLGMEVIISPSDTECYLNDDLTIMAGGQLIIMPGKKLTVKGKGKTQ